MQFIHEIQNLGLERVGRDTYPVLVPSGKDFRGRQPPFERAARKSVSSVAINVFPGTLRKIGGLEKNLSLEEILLRFDLEFQRHTERVLVIGED